MRPGFRGFIAMQSPYLGINSEVNDKRKPVEAFKLYLSFTSELDTA